MSEWNKKLTEMARMAESIEAQAVVEEKAKQTLEDIALNLEVSSATEALKAIGLRTSGDGEHIDKVDPDDRAYLGVLPCPPQGNPREQDLEDDFLVYRQGMINEGIAKILSECKVTPIDVMWILGSMFRNNGWCADHEQEAWEEVLQRFVEDLNMNTSKGGYICDWFRDWFEVRGDSDEDILRDEEETEG